MLRRRAALAAAALVAATGAVVTSGAVPAEAADPACGLGCVGEGDAGWTATAYAVSVTVRGGGGAGGTSGTVRTTVPGPPPPCRYISMMTPTAEWPPIADYDRRTWAEQGLTPEDQGYDSVTGMPLGHEENLAKDGQYWAPMCQGASEEVSDAWFAANNLTFVEAGQAPPPPPPPTAEQLLDIAEQHLVPPPPEVSLNPAATGYVGLPTWVWTDQASFEQVSVLAEAGPNWAEVVADPAGMSVESPGGAQEGTCATGGTPWSPGATTDCTIVFERASVRTGTWPVTVTTTWEASYRLSTGETGGLLSETAGASVDVPVGEVQTLAQD
ncbi:hypothetical protein [uncultured Pseudokineococcus sp.]|uniref:hypothetical protein n=1 Tax=uncultured Pseudokineococcus sp. TaxID=1642928 RepID=UPI00263131F9|nr:hypothetical protein [uncultured Pseudokineococcus sp.]